MKTKEEIIKEALGDKYIYNAIDENGWSKRVYDHKIIDTSFFDLWDMTDNIFCIRPKSLQGIENNNGWIKINSEDDLPKENGLYFTYSKTTWYPFYRIDVFTGRLSNSFENGKSCFTHYQPTIKPKPPHY